MAQAKGALAAEYEPAAALGRRRSVRAPVSLDARVGRGGLDRALCRIVDLSLHGARLRSYSELVGGSHIWLSIPKLGQRAARVAWADGFEAGLEFVMPLREDEFEMLTSD
ncbi:PilZ domain-containing protein [Sphingomonas sp.]|uniref:PilZ domain-containing protein n=1 Tax=Sphingomonas sp. TaxID=28214 RepID=UPI001B22FD78|nr:PilZ domain-containing protein [Sphingomonas sp.]MBO9711916.1 PilZ domain-containing protein [Sphingomonas sp.]